MVPPIDGGGENQMPRKLSPGVAKGPGDARGNIHSRLLIAALLLGVAFLALEVVARIWDLYRRFPPVDLPLHLLAGMAVCAFGYWVALRRGYPHPRGWALGLTLVVALAWEGAELVQERLWPDPPWLEDVFLWDGFFDVLASLLGGILAFPFLRWLRRHFRAFAPLDV